MKRNVGMLAIAVVLAAGCTFGGRAPAQTAPGTPSATTNSAATPTFGGPECPAATDVPLLGRSPLNASDFTAVIPLGNLNPPGHVFPTSHVYFALDREPGSADLTRKAPVFTPARGWVVDVVAAEHLSAKPPYTDYNLRLSPCRQFSVSFWHLSALSPGLADAIGAAGDAGCITYETGGEGYRYCERRLAIEVHAGEQLGMAGGLPGQYMLDFGAFDARIAPLAFAGIARHHRDPEGVDVLHAVCPVNYFDAATRSGLEGRFGRSDGKEPRTAEPRCGTVMQDLPGTAQGIWYVAGTVNEYPEDPHLALVHDNVDPTVATVSVGTSIPGLASQVYPFRPKASGLVNRDFGDITADARIYCFDSTAGIASWRSNGASLAGGSIVLLSLTTATTLRIERQARPACGAGPWTFGNGAVDFER